jgi:hypothetical protein
MPRCHSETHNQDAIEKGNFAIHPHVIAYLLRLPMYAIAYIDTFGIPGYPVRLLFAIIGLDLPIVAKKLRSCDRLVFPCSDLSGPIRVVPPLPSPFSEPFSEPWTRNMVAPAITADITRVALCVDNLRYPALATINNPRCLAANVASLFFKNQIET